MKIGRKARALLTAVVVGLAGVGALPAFGAVSELMAKYVGFTADSETQSGDDSSTYYTLNLNSNTRDADAGTVTIGSSKPLCLEYSSDPWSGNTYGITIMMKYKNLSVSSETSLITTSQSTGTNSGLGCGVNSSMQVQGISSGGIYSDGGTGSAIDSSGYLIYTYYYANGSRVYFVNDSGTASNVYSSTGLRANNANVGLYACLGGTYAGSKIATDMVVEGVVVYKGYISSTDEALLLVQEYETTELSFTDTTTSVSAINEALNGEESGIVTLSGSVTLALDEALATPVTVKGSGTLTLSADAADVASYSFDNLDLSSFSGAVLRSWVTDVPVMGFNFNASNATNTTSAYISGIWLHDTTGAKGTNTAFFTELFSDTFTKLTWSANNLYANNGSTYAPSGSSSVNEFIRGYLDDGAGVSINLTAVPYESYDVIIYCATDTSNVKFTSRTVNGTAYTWDDDANETIAGSSTWGNSTTFTNAAVYGTNTLRVNGLSGNLTISSVKSSPARGGISAIQIMPTGTTAPTLRVGSTDTATADWSTAANWDDETVATSGPANIVLSGDATVTVDSTASLGAVTVSGTGTLTLDVDSGASISAATLQSSIPVVLLNDFDVEAVDVTGGLYHDYAPTAIRSLSCGAYYRQGAGSSTSATAVSLIGGTMGLQSGTFYFPSYKNMASATQTTVDVSGTSVIDMSAAGASDGNRFSVGQATYTLFDTASITAERFVLSDGADGRTSYFTMSNSSSVAVSGRSSYHSVDSNQSDIMFGHWKGPSTFTMEDTSTFTATDSDVLVGKTGYNQTINLNGGTMSVKGIKTSASASGTNTLTLNGGTLELGATGIDSYSASRTIPVTVSSDSTLGGSATTVPVTQTVTVDSGATLTLVNVDYEDAVAADSGADTSGISDITITLTNTLSCAGSLVIRPKVNVQVADATVEGDVTGDGTLTVTGTASLMALSEASASVALSGDTAAVTVTLDASGKISTSSNAQSITVVLTDDQLTADQTFRLASGSGTSDTAAEVTFVDYTGDVLASDFDGDGNPLYSVTGTYKTLTLTSELTAVNWNATGVWEKGGETVEPPTSSERAYIVAAEGVTGTVTATAGDAARILTVQGGGTVTIASAENLSLETSETLTVDSGTTLVFDVSANTTNNLPALAGGGTFVKTGDGTVWRQTTEASPNVADAMTLRPDAGTFRIGLDDAGAGADPILSGVTLVFTNSAAVFSCSGDAKVSGALAIQLQGGVTNSLAAVAADADQPVLSASDGDATLTVTNLGTDPALFGAPVDLPTTLGENVTLSLLPATELTSISNILSGAGALLVPSNATYTVSGANTFTGGATIEEGGAVTVGSATPFGTATSLAGGGQVIISDYSYVPYANGTTAALSNPFGVTFTNEDWTGTVTFRGVTLALANGTGYLRFQNHATLANANSTLEYDGWSGYFLPSAKVTAKEIKISKTTLSSGSSDSSSATGCYGMNVLNGNGGTYAYFIGKLTGEGPIALSTASPTFCLSFVGDFSDWTGDASTANSFRLLFASSTNETVSTGNSITVSTNISLNVGTWSTGTAIVNEGATLNVSSNTAVTASSGMTLADGVRLVASDTASGSPATFTAAITTTGTTTIGSGYYNATSMTVGEQGILDVAGGMTFTASSGVALGDGTEVVATNTTASTPATFVATLSTAASGSATFASGYVTVSTMSVAASGTLNVTSNTTLRATSSSTGITFADATTLDCHGATEELPAYLTAALVFNGTTTIVNGCVQSTTGAGSTSNGICLGTTDAELIHTGSYSGAVTSGVDGYAIRTKSVGSYSAYYLFQSSTKGLRIYFKLPD